MKKIFLNSLFFLFIVLTSFSYTLQAQTTLSQTNSRHRAWLLDVTTGVNIDLIRSSSAPESKLLESKPRVVPVLGTRLTYLFSDKIGGYARLNINLYNSKKSTYDPSGVMGDIMKDFVNELFPAATKIHPALDAGIIYRFEQNRWSLHPGIGIGYLYYLPNRKSTESREKNGTEYSVSYTQQASPVFLNLSLSARYLLSRRGSLVLDINFQQPLQKSSAELVTRANGAEPEKKSYRTSTAGKNINISLGYGITF